MRALRRLRRFGRNPLLEARVERLLREYSGPEREAIEARAECAVAASAGPAVVGGSNGQALNGRRISHAEFERIYGPPTIVGASAPEPRAPRRYRVDTEIGKWLEISDLAKVMQNEIEPPAMLLEGWLQEGALHWFQGEPEDGKSWVAAWCASQVIVADKSARVLWLDSEMGQRTMAERLLALGMDARTVARQFVHSNLSVLPRAGFEDFRAWVRQHEFRLVIWDSMAQHFAGADVDDDRSNSEVAWWISEVVNPVEQYGGTTICVDHLAKSGESRGYARGAGNKRGRARVIYEFKKVRPFDRHEVGEITVTRRKNSASAEIPEVRSISIGGSPSGFVFRATEIPPEGRREEQLLRDAQYRRNLIATLRHQAEQKPDDRRLSFSKWIELTDGKDNRLRKIARELLHDPEIREDLSYGPAVDWEATKTGSRETVWVWIPDEQDGA
jgi:hypothetical protein